MSYRNDQTSCRQNLTSFILDIDKNCVYTYSGVNELPFIGSESDKLADTLHCALIEVMPKYMLNRVTQTQRSVFRYPFYHNNYNLFDIYSAKFKRYFLLSF